MSDAVLIRICQSCRRARATVLVVIKDPFSGRIDYEVCATCALGYEAMHDVTMATIIELHPPREEPAS